MSVYLDTQAGLYSKERQRESKVGGGVKKIYSFVFHKKRHSPIF